MPARSSFGAARLHASLILLCAFAVLAACSAWEGPGNWLHEAYAVGEPASLCVPTEASDERNYRAEHVFQSAEAGWSAHIRAAEVQCVEHRPPFGASPAVWMACRVKAPALIVHRPAIAGAEAFVVEAGAFDLRATRRGLSCRPSR